MEEVGQDNSEEVEVEKDDSKSGLQLISLMQGRLCALCFHLAMVHLCNVRKHVIKRHSVGPEHKKIIKMEHKHKEEKTKNRDY